MNTEGPAQGMAARSAETKARPEGQQPGAAGMRPESHLLNLLAIIHRDGGHHTEEHGIERSVADAEAKVVALRDQIRYLTEGADIEAEPTQAAPSVQVPPDVLKAAQDFVENDYRGPLAWAKKVFDWVAAQALPAAQQPVPEDVMRSARRLATPLHPSRIEPGMGATIRQDEADAARIVAFLESLTAQQPAVEPVAREWHSGGVPPAGSTCLVWAKPSYAKEPYYTVNDYGEQHETPLSWSSATIPIGEGWDSFDHEDVLAWSLLDEAGPLASPTAQPGEKP